MLNEKPQKRPAAKTLLQTKLLKDRIEHIRSSFFSKSFLVEIDPTFFSIFSIRIVFLKRHFHALQTTRQKITDTEKVKR